MITKTADRALKSKVFLRKAMNLPAKLQKQMVISFPITMLLGFLFGHYFNAEALSGIILPMTFLMVYPNMVGLDFKRLLSPGDSKLQVITQAFNFLVYPLIAYGLGLIFFANSPILRLGLFMTSLFPTSGMTIAWVNMVKGNLPSAVKMTVIGLLTGSLLAPFYMQFAFGKSIDLPMGKTISQIALVVFLPMMAGLATQKILIAKNGVQKFNQKIKPKIAPWSTMGVLGVQFAAMALKADDLTAKPHLLLYLGIPILTFYFLNFAISTLVSRFFKERSDGMAFIYGSALRNLPIALAIAMAVLGCDGAEVTILISLGFIIQAQMAAWHVKWMKKSR
ncbi:MAG: arsenic resistance protein [Fibrobacter sp.]|nr:arsenic resistance protein [Fibrobacter sp.]